MLPVVALVGRPNVGKSTLFNVLTRTRDALVANMPGLTRDRHYGICHLGEREFVIVDTGGLTDDKEGMGALTARQAELATDEAEVANGEDEGIRVAIVSRPNVGKSTLVNRLLGEERVVVSDIAGTTRDAIDTRVEIEGRPVVLVDTAGLRRRTKVAGTVDFYAQLRSERAAERADVAIVVCDASEGVTTEDMRIADLAMHKHCATVIALNKWDVNDMDLEFAKARVKQKLRQRPRVLTVSAKNSRGVRRLLLEAIGVADRARGRIPTTELNRFLSDIQS